MVYKLKAKYVMHYGADGSGNQKYFEDSRPGLLGKNNVLNFFCYNPEVHVQFPKLILGSSKSSDASYVLNEDK